MTNSLKNHLRYFVYRKHKNSHFRYYLRNTLSYLLPDCLFRSRLSKELAKIKDFDTEYIANRVDYYCKVNSPQNITPHAIKNSDLRWKPKTFTPHTHFFDTYQYTRYYPKNNHISLLFGDVTEVPDCPSIVKSRPIEADNQNAVLLNLNKLRHFVFLKDSIRFQDKKDMLLGRCSVYRQWRVKFWEMYFGHPLCDLGAVNKSARNKDWIVPPMTLDDQLQYKFILALEGNDVATNLKWIMSSNSIAVMPTPTYETWFMEGKLVPDYHYIQIKNDYSDLPERLEYYIKNTDKALQIIENAHRHVEQFLDKEREKLISLLVLKKYFTHVFV